MQEVFTYIQLKCYFYPPGKPDHGDDDNHFFSIRFLTNLLKSSFKWMTASRWISNKKLFSFRKRTHWHSLLLTLFRNLTRLQQTTLNILWPSIYWTSSTSTTSAMRTVVRAQPHQQLMIQPFMDHTIAPVYPWLPSFAARLSPTTT